MAHAPKDLGKTAGSLAFSDGKFMPATVLILYAGQGLGTAKLLRRIKIRSSASFG
jgi:hypothetical protein